MGSCARREAGLPRSDCGGRDDGLQQPAEILGTDPRILENLGKNLRAHALGVVEGEGKRSPVGVHQEAMTSSPAHFAEAGSRQSREHAPGG